MPEPSSGRFRLPDGSRSVQSVWVWRGFLFMSLIAFGLCLSFAVGGMTFYAVAWAVITLGWFSISMWLWRKHVRADDLAWQASQRGGGKRTG
jgi:hypothetical protein